MKYYGQELTEFKSESPVLFEPPKRMLVWDKNDSEPIETNVIAYLPRLMFPALTETTKFIHCAEIPEQPESVRATNRELSKWLAQGNGELLDEHACVIHSRFMYATGVQNELVLDYYRVRKWNDEEWHAPTIGYMGLK